MTHKKCPILTLLTICLSLSTVPTVASAATPKWISACVRLLTGKSAAASETGRASSVPEAVGLTENKVATPSVSETRSRSVYTNLPEDIKAPTIRAVESRLGIGVADPLRGQWLSHWSISAVQYLRLMGIPEEQIAQKVTERLEQFLSQGRSQGLSQPITLPKLLSGPPNKTPALVQGFYEKYDLAAVKAKLDRLGAGDRRGGSSYTVSTDDAFSLALEINNIPLATEIFVHMLRLRDYDRAAKAAEKIPDSDNFLYNIGLFAISDFYNVSGHTNHIWDAIEALKRIQGPMKPQAEELLTDLAKELMSPELIASLTRPQRGQPNPSAKEVMEVKIHNAEYALRALRVTGKLVGKVALDSVKVDFLTEVSDPTRIKLVQEIVDFIFSQTKRAFGGDSDQILLALTAIKDTARLNKIAADIFNGIDGSEPNRRRHLYDAAFDYFYAAGNKIQAHAVLQKQASNLSDTDLFGIRIYMLRNAAKIGAMDVVNKIDSYAQNLVAGKLVVPGEDRQASDAKEILENVRDIRAGTYTPPLDKTIPLNGGKRYVERFYTETIERETRIKQEIAEYRAKLTPEKQQSLIRQGNELMNGRRYWDAYRIFAEALYRPGLIQVAELMTQNGDGLNAVTPLLYAAFLPSGNSIEAPAQRPALR